MPSGSREQAQAGTAANYYDFQKTKQLPVTRKLLVGCPASRNRQTIFRDLHFANRSSSLCIN